MPYLLETLLSPFLLILSILLLIRYLHTTRPSSSSKSVAVIVLGDIGRSPRMLFHVRSLIEEGYLTWVVGYKGSQPPQDLLESKHIIWVHIPQPFAFISSLPRPLFLLFAPLKVVSNALSLLHVLMWGLSIAPSFFLVQNPPAIPTLPVVQLASLIRGSKIIIDWHNTGYSVLALRLGDNSPVVRLARWIETFWGRDAFAHLCVTKAMKEKLVREAKIRGRAVVFHDRPPSSFRKLSVSEAHSLFLTLPLFSSPSLLSFIPPPSQLGTSSSTPFTIQLSPSSPPLYRTDRPALLLSATSWTADEDFSVLLRALGLYEKAAVALNSGEGGVKGEEKGKLPKLIVVITGKGALKEAFEKEVAKLEKEWSWVRVRTAWLAIEDYPKLLGSADLGISLHTSTSGADLPMKVVDMFGCGLPVLAKAFACVDELVKDGINGRTFKTDEDLADQLITLLKPFPDSPSQLDLLRAGIKDAKYGEGEESKWGTWEENWERVVEPLIRP